MQRDHELKKSKNGYQSRNGYQQMLLIDLWPEIWGPQWESGSCSPHQDRGYVAAMTSRKESVVRKDLGARSAS